ncbi:Transmembrane protein 19 [Linnemannia schmuckeri]|uniref:Transmembrane protein 19 n=1 Tax=Linnemannia schmuckeri TaxID=64567 RepID=A0A9P5V702_9FUNG|nr:Transmembrane protein 19 [Linnemannia schmuckeri]
MSSSKSLLPAGMSPAGFLYPAALCAFMVRHGLTKKSLAPSGALAATFVGIGTFTNSPYVFGSILLTFYLSSSKLTKWASELGILNKSWPTLITTFKKVPPGTNGGVSPLGLGASLGGGLLIGITAAISIIVQLAVEAPISWSSGNGLTGLDTFTGSLNFKFLGALVLAGAGAGLFGSLLDSVLGATVQKSNYSTKKKVITYKAPEKDDEIKAISGLDILDNHQVNFFSSLIIAVATGYLSLKTLF